MKELFEKLKTLDPKNDEHWTDQGLPRVSVLGIQGLNRKDITDAAPLFTRDNPALPEENEDDDLFGEDENKSHELESEVETLTEQDFLGKIAEAEKVQEEAAAVVKKLRTEYENFVSSKVDRGNTTQQDIMFFIKKQNELRMKRVQGNFK